MGLNRIYGKSRRFKREPLGECFIPEDGTVVKVDGVEVTIVATYPAHNRCVVEDGNGNRQTIALTEIE